MAEERKLIISLEVNAKGEAVLRALKKEVDELAKADEKRTEQEKRSLKNEKEITTEREKGAQTARKRRKEEQGLTDDTTKGAKATEKSKTEEEKRTVVVERGRRVVSKKKDEERAHTVAVDEGAKAVDRSRDSLGRFVGAGERAKRTVVELANSQGQLTSAIGVGVVKAQLFLNLLSTGFRIGVGLAINPTLKLAGGIRSLVENVVQATQRFDRFRITLEGALKSADRARAVSEFVQQYALTSPQKIEDVQELTKSIALIPALRGQFFGDFEDVKTRLRDIYDTVIGLSSLNPQQGIPGAVFAIREALAGQFRSLRARFDIMPEIVAGSIGKTVSEIKKSPKLVIAALKEFVNQSVGSDTLRELGRLPEVRIGNIVESLTSIAPRQIGSAGFQPFIQDLLGQIDDSLQGFFKDGGPFQTQFAPRISERLRGIVIQSLRLLGNILGGVDTALGGAGAPTMERIAQVFENVLGRVEQAIKGFADRFAQSRDSIANFFSTIVEVLKKSFDLFVDIVNNLPSILPVFAGFFNAMVDLTRQVFDFIAAIPKLLGEIGGNTLLSGVAPGLAESFRTTGNVSKVSELISTQRGDRNVESEFKAASEALMDLALEGKDAFRDMQEGFKDPRRGFFREFFRGEISAGGDRGSLIKQLLTQLGAGGGGKDRGSELADRIAAEGKAVQATISARERLESAMKTSATVESKLTSRIEEREKLEKARIEAEQGVVSRLNTQNFEIETREPISPEFAGFGLGSTTSSRPVPSEAIRRSLAQLTNRVPGEFGGAVAGIKDLGLQVQERLSKLLLDPLQEADQEFIQAEAAQALAVENLAKAVEGATSEAAERVKSAIEQIGKDVGAGILTSEQGEELRKRIFDTSASVTDAIGKASALNTRQSAQYFAQAIAGGFQSAIGTLTKTDLNDARELDRAFAGVNSRLSVMQPLLTEVASTTFADLQAELSAILRDLKPDAVSVGTSFLGFDPTAALDLVTKAKADFKGLGEVVSVVNGLMADPIGLVGEETQRRLTALVDRVNEFTVTLGREGVKNLASFAFASRSQEFQKAQGIKGAFGGGLPEAEIKSLEEQLRIVQTRSKVEERIREILNDRAVLDKERTEFENQISKQVKEQADGIALTLAVKRQALEISKAEEDLQRRLQTEFDPEARYALIKDAVGKVQDKIEGIKAALDDPTGQQVALLLGIADPDKARAAAEGAVQALEARRKQLEDTARASDPNEISRRAQQGIPGRTISAQGVFDALPKSQREAIIAEYGELGTATATAFLDKFQLLTSDGAKARLKTFGELLQEEIVQLATRVVDLVQTAVSDTLYNVFKGQFDSIQQVWDSFLDGLLRAFADFISQLLVRAAVMEAIKSFGFGFADGGVTGPIVPLASGAVVGPGAGGPIMALIGEGSRKEGIVPLTTAGAIPATVTNQGLAATLPGNRTIPIAIGGYANGGVVSGAQPVAMPKYEAPSVYVINTLDSAEVVAAGLPANAVVIENQVAGSIRSRGAVGKSIRRYGRG